MKLRNKIGTGILVFIAVAFTSLALVLSHNSACMPAPAVSDGTELMKAIVYRCYGSTDVLQLEDIEKPTPADDEVLVKIHAASVNPLDWHYMRGTPYLLRLGSGIGAPTARQYTMRLDNWGRGAVLSFRQAANGERNSSGT